MYIYYTHRTQQKKKQVISLTKPSSDDCGARCAIGAKISLPPPKIPQVDITIPQDFVRFSSHCGNASFIMKSFVLIPTFHPM